MRQGPSQRTPLGSGAALGVDTHAVASAPSPLCSHGEAVYEREVGGYFDLPRREDAQSPTSDHSSLSLDIPSHPTITSAALTALQYLPIPVLVLSSSKTVVLANESMGRLLAVDMRALQDDKGDILSITDVLQGQTISQLGIEILQHGSPILISWEVRSFPTLHLMLPFV